MAALDVLWSQYVRLTPECERCGKKGDLEAHHIMPRIHKTTRWLYENSLALCTRCHHWAHYHPEEFRAWLGQNYGVELYERLQQLAKEVVKFSREELEQKIVTMRKDYLSLKKEEEDGAGEEKEEERGSRARGEKCL